MTVGLVLVAHVVELAAGVRTLAAQMAPDVPIVAAGGTDDGGIGTSFGKIEAGVAEALTAAGDDGVVVLYDLGSAQLTADMVVDTLDPSRAELVRLVDAPLVEGALAAATTAAGGGTLDQVVAAVEAAGTTTAAAGHTAAEAAGPGAAGTETARGRAETAAALERATARTVLRNSAGLHARPASRLARLVSGFDATVEVGRPGRGGVDATSVLGVVAQGFRVGDEIELVAAGPQAQVTLDAILAAVDEGFGELEVAPSEVPEPAAGLDAVARGPDDQAAGVHLGLAASPGIAIGPLRHLHRAEPVLPAVDETRPTDRRTEGARLETALAQVDADLATRARADGPAAEIAGAHQAMLADPALRQGVLDRIEAGAPAELAWWEDVRNARDLFAAGEAYVAERVADVEDLGRAVLAALGVDMRSSVPAHEVRGAVIVADDLLPSDVPALAGAGAVGVALAAGGPTAHASIIARGLELPLVVGLGRAVRDVADGTDVILDGSAGTVQVDPPPSVRDAARTHARRLADQRAEAGAAASALVIRYEGRRVLVTANVASAAEARVAVVEGADGVGLLRTELMYVDRAELPDEDAQVAELAAILRALGDLPAVVRTLDVGGDKLLPALALDPLRHGPLGERGLRHGLRHPEILRTQLRAILRAAYERSGEVSVMAPMVTAAAEVRAFRQLVDEAAAELAADGRGSPRPIRVGVMIEVPAAALAATEICAAADFVSVGTNDLTQYLTAADRTNASVSHLYRQDHPAVWRVIELLVTDARRARCEVAVCGELAADPRAAERLVRLGVAELSMAPASIPAVKRALHQAYDSET
ncbi:MAG: phosphoenolpyruvate--protein phosphotransferase [Actinopolymorphaceae bacterium]